MEELRKRGVGKEEGTQCSMVKWHFELPGLGRLRPIILTGENIMRWTRNRRVSVHCGWYLATPGN